MTEQVHEGAAFTIAHAILFALVHSPDPYMDDDVAIWHPRQNKAPAAGLVSLEAFFREHLDQVFTLNKDPTRVEKLVGDMKSDFSSLSNGAMTPNRMIIFEGGSKFYKDLFMGNAMFLYTGYKLGGVPNLLQQALKGDLTLCESFAVKTSADIPDSSSSTRCCRPSLTLVSLFVRQGQLPGR
jgi:hypothetical protein